MEHESCSCDVCAVLREYPYNLPYIPVNPAASANLAADAGSASISAAAAASSNIIPADPALTSFIPTDVTSFSNGFSGDPISASNLFIDGTSDGASQTAQISAEILLGDQGASTQFPFHYPGLMGPSPILQIPQPLAEDEQNPVQFDFGLAQPYQFRCELCGEPQSNAGKYNRHLRTKHKTTMDPDKWYKCQYCGRQSSRSDNRDAHEKSCWDRKKTATEQ
ncbi:hypothetical protein GGI35DRAFT_484621 [Trichoderma velutinum]